MKIGLPLIKNLLKPVAKSVLILLGLTATTLAADVKIHKKFLGSGITTLVIANKEMEDEAIEKRGGFLTMLVGTLGANLLGYLLARKG